nr:uncharacterized protein LOC113817979 [Penaeus vannamei]
MSDTALVVLRSRKDISTAWLEELLKQRLKSNVEVISWTSKPPSTKNYFMSEMCFVQVTFKGPNHPTEERSLVVKFAPTAQDAIEFMKNGNLARKEIEFYKFVLTDDFRLFCEKSGLKNPVPDVYWADLKITTTFEQNSDIQSPYVIHACGVATIKKHGREYLDVPSGDFLDTAVKIGLDREVEMFKGTRTAETLRALYSLREEMIDTRSPLFETLIHGDLWTGNVMFSGDNTSAVILDWQFASVDNPVCDILSLLLMSSHPVVYEQHLNDVLRSYWQSLTEALEKNGASVDCTFEDLSRCVEEMWMYGFMFFTASLPDLLDNNITALHRGQNAVKFLEQKKVLSKFLQSHGKEMA